MSDTHAFAVNQQSQVKIMRLIRRKLEKFMGFSLTDEQFSLAIEAFHRGYPMSPIGGGYSRLGFIRPFDRVFPQKVHDAYGYTSNGNHRLYSRLSFRFYQFFYEDDIRCESYRNIILHIPHSASQPLPECTKIQFEGQDVYSYSRPLVDWYTDTLFQPECQQRDRVRSLVFPWNRVTCDVERMGDDPLERDGLGVCHHHMVTFNHPEWAEHAYKLYIEHQAKLANMLVASGFSCLLIDCHSFSSEPTVLCPEPPEDVDICLGYNEDSTKPDGATIQTIRMYFFQAGYRVAVNSPFSNSKTVSVPGDSHYHSIMIEVNKRLYMDEKTLKKTDGFNKLQKDIQGLYDLLLVTH